MALPLSVFEPLLNAREADGLSDFLKELEGELSRFSTSKTGFLAQLVDYVLTGSGKRVRPALVYVASRFGKADKHQVMQTALAVELIHVATLVHDDLVDEAVMRRSKATVGVKFGDGAAVLLGDYVYAQAFQRLASIGRPELLQVFADTTLTMCDGEIGQYEGRYAFDVSEADYLEFLRKKTASLMASSAWAGGVLAGLPAEQSKALEVFGDKIGVAFQVVDDLLDLEGEEDDTGKTLRTDLLHGKMTMPLIRYAAALPAAERQSLFEVLKNPNGQLSDLVKKVLASGVMKECRARVDGLVAEAENALSSLPDHPSRSLLKKISSRLSDRKV
jgi:geranylgeranyl pyrophosphate synthase